jgi:hypothetical protein
VLAALFWFSCSAPAQSPVLGTNDVVAFVGGEDVVAMQQHGYVELDLAFEIQSRNLRFRNLGWEGDTVFEQRRELNFPTWEQTLAKIGATVIVAQFGQAESLHGVGALSPFTTAADRFLSSLASTNRRLVVLAPTRFERPAGQLPDLTARSEALRAYSDALRSLATRRGWTFVEWQPPRLLANDEVKPLTRDGLHLNALGQWFLASGVRKGLGVVDTITKMSVEENGAVTPPGIEELRQAIVAKNQLWFDYWRPQNWAFLAGDRTEQPSSRDHRNPKLRWFPNEMELFLPLIEAKEREVRMLTEKLP